MSHLSRKVCLWKAITEKKQSKTKTTQNKIKHQVNKMSPPGSFKRKGRLTPLIFGEKQNIEILSTSALQLTSTHQQSRMFRNSKISISFSTLPSNILLQPSHVPSYLQYKGYVKCIVLCKES